MSTPDAETWLSSGQLGQRWKVDSKTITRYAVNDGLPFDETPGGHRRYNVAEAEAWRESLAGRRQAMRTGAATRLTARLSSGDGNGELARTAKETP